MTEEQKNSERYCWLFNDVDLAALNQAFVENRAPPATVHSDVLDIIMGHYCTKEQADRIIDQAMAQEKL